ncbi:oligosaccharide flippase family protein [Antrihabitans spumae]|uniref:Oligosaccharide flippase family protein n=1 Tax=Antrihabitans spumae TaxID=3373370 RepID=A0ABW7KR26_9NOCA
MSNAAVDGATAKSGDDALTDPNTLTKSIGRVAGASALALVFGEIVTLGQTVALARLLSPTEVGLFVAGTVLTALLSNFVEGGLRAGLVQREGDLEDAAETVFWATIASGVVMSLCALAAAPIIGMIFKSSTAAAIAALTSGLLLLFSLTNVPDAFLQRNFSVKRRLIVSPAVALSFAVVSVVLAACGFGVWSMVVGTYVSYIVWIIAVWTLTDWRPGRGKASYKLWRELARFGSPVVIGLMGSRIQQAVESAVVGRTLSSAALGQYRYGQRIAQIPVRMVIEIGAVSLFPAFSRIAGDTERLKAAYLRALKWATTAAAPICGLIIALGEPAVVVVFGEPWRAAGTLVVAMAGLGLGKAWMSVSEEAIKGAGRTRLLNWQTMTEILLGIGLLLLLVNLFGLIGVGIAVSATALIVACVVVGLAIPVVQVSVRQVVLAVLPPLPAAAIALAVTWALENFVFRAEYRSLLTAVLLLSLATFVYLVVYIGILAIFAPAATRELFRVGLRLVGRAIRRPPKGGGDSETGESVSAEQPIQRKLSLARSTARIATVPFGIARSPFGARAQRATWQKNYQRYDGGELSSGIRVHIDRVWARKWVVLGVALVTVALSLFVSQSDVTTYTSRASLTIGSPNRAPEQDAVLSVGYADYFSDAQYQDKLKQTAGIAGDVSLSARTAASSPILYIDATADSSELAAAAATKAATAFRDEINASLRAAQDSAIASVRKPFDDIRAANGIVSEIALTQMQDKINQINGDTSNKLLDLQLESEASVNSPAHAPMAAIGLGVGIVLGVIAALGLGAFSRRLRSTGDVVSKVGLEPLSTVPRSAAEPALRDHRIRQLVTRVALAATTRAITFTSPHATVGTEQVARAFAVARAKQGVRTVLVHADLRHTHGRGVGEILLGSASLDSVLVSGGSADLYELSPGTISGDPFTAVTRERFGALVDELLAQFDLVVVAAPALLDAAETQVICAATGQAVLVLETAASRSNEAREALRLLDQVDTTLLGSVLIDVRDDGPPALPSAPTAAADRSTGQDAAGVEQTASTATSHGSD